MRWSERNYLAHGIDPYDVSAQFTGEPITAQEATRIQQYHLQGEKACLPSGYPPWGIAASFLLLWTNNLAAAKMLFASFTIACLLGTCWMVYLLAKPTGIQGAQMLAALVFGMFANCSVLRAGQYALILNAFLLVAVLMIERRRQVATGLAMCLPAIKPTVSLPQFLVLIVRGEWIAILVSALVCAALAGLSWFLTGVDPIEMTQQMLRQAGAVAHGGTSLLEVLSGILTFSRANILLALCGVVLTLLSAFLLRRQSILPSLAISCIIGRFFYYHRQYDNAMLDAPYGLPRHPGIWPGTPKNPSMDSRSLCYRRTLPALPHAIPLVHPPPHIAASGNLAGGSHSAPKGTNSAFSEPSRYRPRRCCGRVRHLHCFRILLSIQKRIQRLFDCGPHHLVLERPERPNSALQNQALATAISGRVFWEGSGRRGGRWRHARLVGDEPPRASALLRFEPGLRSRTRQSLVHSPRRLRRGGRAGCRKSVGSRNLP